MTKDDAYRFVKNFNDQNRAMLKLEEILALLSGSDTEFARIERRKTELLSQEDEIKKRVAEIRVSMEASKKQEAVTLANLDANYKKELARMEKLIQPTKDRLSALAEKISGEEKKLDEVIAEKNAIISGLNRDIQIKQGQLEAYQRQVAEIKAKFS